MISIVRLPSLRREPAKRSRKTLKPLKWPTAEATRYAKQLLEIVRATEVVIRREVFPPVVRFSVGFPIGPYRVDDAADDLAEALERSKLTIPFTESQAANLAVEMLQRVQTVHGERFIEAYDDVLAIDPFVGAEPWLREQMTLRARDNVNLIRSLPQDLLGDVEGVVTREVLAGTHARDIAKLISERFEVAENRALLIATDQVGKWFGSLDKLRQQDAGVSEYKWKTAGDEHVRPKHRALNNTIRKWGEGIEPGQEVRCRCQSIPVIPDYDDDGEEL